MQVKNIIFDLGGVILNIDYQKTIDAFKQLGIKNFDVLFTQAKQELLFDRYEKGEISSNEFISHLQNKFSENINKATIKDAWNAMLLDLPNERLNLLNNIKSNYNTALLSNTNEIHLDAFHEIIQKENVIEDLNPYFDEVYFSCRMNMRKPDPEIFKKVCQNRSYTPNETLFIDDSIQHVEGAQKAGLFAIHLENKSILDLFNENYFLKEGILS